jgi:hypothetical protein
MLTKTDKAPDGTLKADEPKTAVVTPVDRTRASPAAPAPRNQLFGTSPFELDIHRVIGGRKFSTSTAALACVIARIGQSQHSDFHYERTGLYLSPRGQWFVAGEGGACSHWSRRAIDGSREPGEGLQLISQTEARRLLEQHGGLVEAFFECEEG